MAREAPIAVEGSAAAFRVGMRLREFQLRCITPALHKMHEGWAPGYKIISKGARVRAGAGGEPMGTIRESWKRMKEGGDLKPSDVLWWPVPIAFALGVLGWFLRRVFHMEYTPAVLMVPFLLVWYVAAGAVVAGILDEIFEWAKRSPPGRTRRVSLIVGVLFTLFLLERLFF